MIDEAAAIPLPHVRALLGPYLVFLASTVNGYEGTGRALSLKLIKELRDQSGTANTGTSLGGARLSASFSPATSHSYDRARIPRNCACRPDPLCCRRLSRVVAQRAALPRRHDRAPHLHRRTAPQRLRTVRFLLIMFCSVLPIASPPSLTRSSQVLCES